MRAWLEQKLSQQWYKSRPGWTLALAPLSLLVKGVSGWRYRQSRKDTQQQPPLPILVVGNISVGGTGKTPLVIALSQSFAGRGLKVVIISRGYGSRAPLYPFVVTANSRVEESGDEALLIARHTGTQVVIDANRMNALQRAMDFQPDIVISDDGLQHYQLPRTAELVVIDGARGLGNGWCLPVGPLRESPSRLANVDWVVINGGAFTYPSAWNMQLVAPSLLNLATAEQCPLAKMAEKETVHAVAAIGNPERFFSTLTSAGLRVQRHIFPDHHDFKAEDICFTDGLPVIMTEKDAVKCQSFARNNHWYLPVTAEIPDKLVDAIAEKLGV
jgi:tetraacyldisaccharide 4'-kinase